MPECQPIAMTEDVDDSISVTSTVFSEEAEDGIYVVDEILFERKIENKIFYLIKWEGYPLHRATWEPEENLMDGIKFDEWKNQRSQQNQGNVTSFDVEAWESDQRRIKEEAFLRREKRYAKRHRLGLLVESRDKRKLDVENDGEEQQSTSPGIERDDIIVITDDETDDEYSTSKRYSYHHRQNRARRVISDSEDSDCSLVRMDPGRNESAACLGNTIINEAGKQPISVPAMPVSNEHTLEAGHSEVDQDLNSHPLPPTTRRISALNVSHPAPKIGSSTTSRAKKTGANILINWNKPKRTKRFTINRDYDVARPKLYTTLSQRRRAELRSRIERTPDPNSLVWFTPNPISDVESRLPGASSSSSLVHYEQPKAPSVETGGDRVTSNPNNKPSLNSIPSNNATNQEVTSVAPILNIRDRAAMDGKAPETSRTTDDPGYPPTSRPPYQAIPPNKVAMICLDWRSGDCRFRDGCRFIHDDRNDLETSPFMMPIPPKYANPPLTCIFWFYGQCRHESNPRACTFAHWNTGLIGSRDVRQPPTQVDRWIVPACSRSNNTLLTCPFWKYKKCFHSAETCKLAHYDTSKVAPFPPGWDISRVVRNGPNTSENMAPQLPPPPPSKTTSESLQISVERVHAPGPPTTNLINSALDPRLHGRTNSIQSNKETPGEDFRSYLAQFGIDDDSKGRAKVLFEYLKDVELEKSYETHPEVFPSGPIKAPAPITLEQQRIANKWSSEMRPTNLETEVIYRHRYGFLRERFFTWGDGKTIESNVFLHVKEKAFLAILLEYFKALDAKVYLFDVRGDEDRFAEVTKSGGVVITGHDFVCGFNPWRDGKPHGWHWGELPHLRTLISRSVNFFQVKDNYSLEENGKINCVLNNNGWLTGFSTPGVGLSAKLQPGDKGRYAFVRIFPHGTLFFLTDTIYAYHFSEALQIYKAFSERWFREVSFSFRTANKIWGRPNLKEFLTKLVEKNVDLVRDGVERDRLLLLDAYYKICPFEEHDEDNGLPIDAAQIISIGEANHPYLKKKLWEEDEDKANEWMINLFAAEALVNAWKWRRFVCVHTNPKPEWREKYKHVYFVTPNECLKQYLQVAKKSKSH